MSRKTSFSTISAAGLTDGNKLPLTSLSSSAAKAFCCCEWPIVPRQQHSAVVSFGSNDAMHYLSINGKNVLRKAKEFCFVFLSWDNVGQILLGDNGGSVDLWLKKPGCELGFANSILMYGFEAELSWGSAVTIKIYIRYICLCYFAVVGIKGKMRNKLTPWDCWEPNFQPLWLSGIMKEYYECLAFLNLL